MSTGLARTQGTTSGSRLDRPRLSRELAAQVSLAEQAMHRTVAEDAALRANLKADHARATTAQRTGTTWTAWLDEQVTLSAVAWVLGTVFVRWCEDNGLIEPRLSGPGERLGDAQDAQQQFVSAHPLSTSADWLREAFGVLAASDAGAMLFDARHNPAERIPLSNDGARALIAYWRTTGADGRVVHDFTDPSWDTRFLGDLYQDLSESARERYALLQTPVFVEDFILSLTLDPAIREFGLDGLRVIDPTCGSGHFLLGSFDRLVAAWRERSPALDPVSLARRALDSMHGVDINPFAVAVARFRLLLAAWRVAGVSTLAEAAGQSWRMAIAVGDSLLPYAAIDGLEEQLGVEQPWEDIDDFADERLLAEGSYDVVVGNPPYITVKDRVLNDRYRKSFPDVCSGKYALTAPFARRFSDLARPGRSAGFVGQITSNSFMKREFGVPLVERFLATTDLTHVIDTSGAYIPGHGTPTVILVSRRRRPSSGAVRAILGTRGEPSQPADPATAHVWTAIMEQIGRPGSSSRWVDSADLGRAEFARHPWSLAGGGARNLMRSVEADKASLRGRTYRIGVFGIMGSDDSMMKSVDVVRREGLETSTTASLVVGEELRDWRSEPASEAFFPYDAKHRLELLPAESSWAKVLWRTRTELGERATFGRGTYFSDGRPFYSWHQLPEDIGSSNLTITFAFVATHNHFVLDRGGKVFNRSAPVIKLPAEATEDDHLGLLGVLNSSAACFWLQQVSHNKGGPGGGSSKDEKWHDFYEFTGTKLERFPLPAELPLDRARRIDGLAQLLSDTLPGALVARATPTRDALADAERRAGNIQRQLISKQEELDWDVYARYGLLAEAERAAVVLPDSAAVDELSLGQRAFEIVLARQVERGEEETQWFTRHGSTPTTELPAEWPADYRRVVQARIELIERRRDIALMERPECKRRWSTPSWAGRRDAAVRGWLLDRLEDRRFWFAVNPDGDPEPLVQTVRTLGAAVEQDRELIEVARLWAADALGTPDADVTSIVGRLVDDEHVPYLAAYRYKGKGLTKRADWEHTWDLQRQEDRVAARLGQDIGHPAVREAIRAELGVVPVPPKYGPPDFVRPSYWGARGKLDVPKERFVSYPGASRDGDGSLSLGWAGWSAVERAQALAALVTARRDEDGWGADRLTPLLAGLAEQLPWVAQWHPEVDPRFGAAPADIYGGFLADVRDRLQLTEDDLAGWRPTGRVDVSPLPKTRATRTPRTPRAPRAPRVPRVAAPPRSHRAASPAELAESLVLPARPVLPVDEHRDAVLDAALGGPLTNEDIRDATGLDTAGARAVAQALADRGLLVVTGQKRGTRYALATA